ncbi:hypothetical protein BH11MYX1_BH11MYX1_01430 [soil metagenome]
MPPPIPAAARSQRPTGLERVLVHVGARDRASELERELVQRPAAATAFHLAELWLRELHEPKRAVGYLRRAVELDPNFGAASWSLRRELHETGAWQELGLLLERELARRGDPEIAFERAIVAVDASAHAEAYAALDRALQLAPTHQGALLECERVLAHLDPRSERSKNYERLAAVAHAPARKLAYSLAAGQFARALALAPTSGERAWVTRSWLRATTDDAIAPVVSAAIAATTELVASQPEDRVARDELVALLCWYARVGPPVEAWDALARAAELAPENSVVLADLAEAATLLERDDLPIIVAAWRLAERRPDQLEMIEWWTARAKEDPRFRPLVRTLAAHAPGFAILAASLESEALRHRELGALAEVYLALARKATTGTWLPGPATPEAAAATTLYIQTAELLSRHVATPGSIERAHAVLEEALANAPESAAAIEAMIALADVRGQPDVAIGMIRSQLGRATQHRALLERAARIAHRHGRTQEVLAVERELVNREPDEPILEWRLCGTLSRLEREDERRELVDKLACQDPDPARRRFALAATIGLLEGRGDLELALERARALTLLAPDDELARARLAGLLRARGELEALVAVREAELPGLVDLPSLRRAFREIAWVLEVRLADRARAAAAYRAWSTRMPDDPVAKEGLLRCGGEDEIATRRALAELEGTPASQFLYARALDRADDARARETYAGLLEAGEGGLGLSAAMCLLRCAAAAHDEAGYASACRYLASHTSHAELAATLCEEAGWCELRSTNLDAARHAFVAAGPRASAWLGRMLVASRSRDSNELETAYVELAAILAVPQLLQRASAIAASNGELVRARERLEAAHTLLPTSLDLFVALDDAPIPTVDRSDPFASSDRLLERAKSCQARAELADDPASRLDFELARAEALELGGEYREAASAVLEVLARVPRSWRVWLALRRLAHQLEHPSLIVHTALGLSQLHRSPAHRLALLREAFEALTGPGALEDLELATAIASQIIALDAAAPELDGYLAMVRQRGDDLQLVRALSLALRRASTTAHLFERGSLLASLGKRELAEADFAAVLDHDPVHLRALERLGSLAAERGDNERAVTLWWRFLAIEVEPARRAEIEDRVAQALDHRAMRRHPAPTEPVPRHTAVPPVSWEAEPTRPDSTAVQTALQLDVTATEVRISSSIIRRPSARIQASAVREPDPFGGATVLADLSVLQEDERREARATSAGDYEVEVTGVSPTSSPRRDVTKNSAIAVALGALDDEPLAGASELFVADLGEDYGHVALALPIRDLQALEVGAAPPPLDPDDSAVVFMSYDELRPAQKAVANDDLLSGLAGLERELGLSPVSDERGELHFEAGRTAVALAQRSIAVTHFEAAIAQGMWAAPALREMRRLAWQQADLAECARLVEAELKLASARERPLLLRYRTDLLMAIGEEDLARVSVGDYLELATNEPAILLASLELAFLDERLPELVQLLGRLDATIDDPAFHSSLAFARGVFMHELVGTPGQLGGVLAVMGRADSILELACQVESEDPILAGSLATLAQERGLAPDLVDSAVQLAARTAPRDPLVARICAEALLASGDLKKASVAFARWFRTKAPASERAYAAARAAELDPSLGRLWIQALELDPEDDYVGAMAYAFADNAGEVQASIEIDLSIARSTKHVRSLIRGAGRLAELDPPRARELLEQAHLEHPTSIEVAEMLAQALEHEGRWAEVATVLGGLVDSLPIVAARHAHAVARSGGDARLGWKRVLQLDPRSPEALAAIPDAVVPELVWERSSESLRARTAAPEGLDDPRQSIRSLIAAIDRGGPLDAAKELVQRSHGLTGAEADVLRLRATMLALDSGAPALALDILDATRLPVYDLRVVAARLAGRAPPVRPVAASSLDRLLREAEAEEDRPAALGRYRDAFAIDPNSRLVRMRYERAALAEDALEDLEELAKAHIADASVDPIRRAEAHVLVARVRERRGKSYEDHLVAALEANPSRLDLIHELARIAAHRHDHVQVFALRQRELGHEHLVREDLATLTFDAALLARRCSRGSGAALQAAREALARDPDRDLALMFVHAAACREPVTQALVELDDRISSHMADANSKASWLVLAAEGSAALGATNDAFARLSRALQVAPGWLPAVHAWERIAVERQAWAQLFALARSEQTRTVGDHPRIAYLAGAAAMQRAHDLPTALEMFRLVLATEPTHREAYLQLRVLVERSGDAGALDKVLRDRLAVEPERVAQLELHRALARSALAAGELERVTVHYGQIAELDPDDRDNWMALAQVALRRKDYESAIRGLSALVATEPDPAAVTKLHCLLGTVYVATSDPTRAYASFHRALAVAPADLDSLTQLSDLAIGQADWQLARTTVDKLTAALADPEQLALAWHRAARISAFGFGDRATAEELHERACEHVPASEAALRALIDFHTERNEPELLAGHFARLATLLRARILAEPAAGQAYRALGLVLCHGAPRLPLAARVALELSDALGTATDLDHQLLATEPATSDAVSDDALFSHSDQHELRRLFQFFAPQVAKVVGIDLAGYGVNRRDRLRATEPPLLLARSTASTLGIANVDVYISARLPYVMVSEPTNPPSVVLGTSIATAHATTQRFAIGVALRLAAMSLSVPARLSHTRLTALGVALTKLVVPEVEVEVDVEIETWLGKLRKLIGPAEIQRARPLVTDASSIQPLRFAEDLQIAGLRSGVLASGSLLAGLGPIATSVNLDLPQLLMTHTVRRTIEVVLG